ncbi:hypothetical protein [Pantoea sp. KPR_PJ]|uniref:hypothetical protein n=1 Tax=Pantoea sp. KPR_PJ TaxID=2738375 RepID=UPI0035288016
MKHKIKNHSENIIISSKVVAGIIVGIVVFLLSYIYSNYVHAAAPEQSPTAQSLNDQEWRENAYTHIVFYRAEDDPSVTRHRLLNISINNQYHTSLMPAFRAIELELCPGQKRIGISAGQLQQGKMNVDQNEEMSATLYSGERYYFQISLDRQGKVNAHWVDENEAKRVLTDLKPEKRLLSRVLNEHYCPEAIYSISTTRYFTHQHYYAGQPESERHHTLPKSDALLSSLFHQVNKTALKS